MQAVYIAKFGIGTQAYWLIEVIHERILFFFYVFTLPGLLGHSVSIVLNQSPATVDHPVMVNSPRVVDLLLA